MRIDDAELRERLEAVGLDPDAPGDPGDAWRRLRERFGRRVTLIDRYALEAAVRGVPEAALDDATRSRLALEVIGATWAGFEIVPGSGRETRHPIKVVPYDPAWPARFEHWRRVLVDSLGAAALRIEHVGSTAVPGLAAKPVIDVQVSVDDLEEEAAYVPAIELAGIGLRSRDREHRYFRPSGTRARGVQVHVCESGSAWERDHLLLRDFLRSNSSTAEAYGRLKVGLAERYRDDRIAYTEAKTGFILDALAAAEVWARDTAWRP